jgi:integrase
MGLMGWSSSAMAVRYQHLTAQVRRDIANRVGGLIWDDPESAVADRHAAPTETTNETGHQRGTGP